jgi:hypothetical protein
MAAQEGIRQLCVQAVRSEGDGFDVTLLALLSALNEYFDIRHDSAPFLLRLRDALNKPPDA